jgi:release factor glutamine methyltransferase
MSPAGVDEVGSAALTARSAGGGADVLRQVADRVGSRREAQWIVEHVACLVDPVRSAAGSVGAEQARMAMAIAMADRRAAGEPLQYVLGRWPFRSLELTVDRRVLIPRPETEQVVEVALGQLRALVEPGADAPGGAAAPVCVDLGTGSGAIALSLAVEGGDSAAGPEVWATDASRDALEVAAINLAGVADSDPVAGARVHLCHGAWFGALPPGLAGRVDLIVSNPPYVAESEYGALDPTVRRWEPRSALVSGRGAGGVGGMADIEEIIAGAPRWLRTRGVLVVEIDPAQAYAAIDAARRAGFRRVGTERDLAGRLRMLVAGR